jgi:hypothetical protein
MQRFVHVFRRIPDVFVPLRRLPTSEARLAKALAELTPRLAATAADHDSRGTFPHDNFALLHQYGLISQAVPVASGGGGAGLAEARRIIAAVAGGDAATALVLTMTYLQHRAIGRDEARWPEAVREQVFRSAVEEGALINSLRVEPELGSPARVVCRAPWPRAWAIAGGCGGTSSTAPASPRCAGWRSGRARTNRSRGSGCSLCRSPKPIRRASV